MTAGFMGKILFVDLSTGKWKTETAEEKLYREFLGGYGLGARILYDRQPIGVDPLGPENILGFTTGPLTGIRGLFGSRFTVVGKSPLTGSWGDANCGGNLGPGLKFAGYDAVFVTGASSHPVYLVINDGTVQLKDAQHLWGKDTNETENVLKSELGKKASTASIGPAGEKLSLISCIMNDRGRAAARSGLGGVMGSKKLKAVAVMGSQQVPVPDEQKVARIAKHYRGQLSGVLYDGLTFCGTSALYQVSALIGDSPIKNWAGVAATDFPNPDAISDQNVLNLTKRRYACWGCSIACGGTMKAGTQYSYEAGAHRPEYETLSSFGGLCLNNNLESIVMANDICNRYGLDTISAGATMAFAIECYENGLITKVDTEGIELRWGDHQAIVAMTEKLAKREGLGEVLADGVKKAAERIGKGAVQYAFHAGGQEIPMHDPRLAPSWGGAYQSDPTPGRHTQVGIAYLEMGAEPPPGITMPPVERYAYTGKGPYEAMFKNNAHAMNASGVCMLAMGALPPNALQAFLSAATGWDITPEKILRIGERIANIRQSFNVREGVTPGDFKIRGRPIGDPPLKEGPTAGITIDADTLRDEYFRAMDWDTQTGKPSKSKLEELGLDDVARELWP